MTFLCYTKYLLFIFNYIKIIFWDVIVKIVGSFIAINIIVIFRYYTYIGLLTATGILLPKSTSLGSIVGIMVMSYIMGAEYYCMINGHMGLVNLTNYDLFQLLRT